MQIQENLGADIIMCFDQCPPPTDRASEALMATYDRFPVTFVRGDLQEVKGDEKFEIRVPVHLIGESYGVKNQSGVLEIASHLLRIVQSLVLDPGDPPLRGPAVRAYLRRWVAPAV